MLQKIEKQDEIIVVTLGRSSASLSEKDFSDHKMLIAEYEKAIASGNDGVELYDGRLSSFKVLTKPPAKAKRKDKASEATEAGDDE